ncbi:MAG: alkaline phosphatase family protein [Elusimicrobia bacterium]|nr:alkaline phosphatase family protein [Elusimicrobiota bacterium]
MILPLLLVVVVVDQFRPDQFERLAAGSGGFARLSKGGFVFSRARHTHTPLETCPGHAALSTGLLPARSGITGNEWWDHDRAAGRSCSDDPLFGKGPAQFLEYTLSDAIRAREPESRAVCVTLKDRAAVALCGRSPHAAVWYDKNAGTLATSPYYGALPAWAKTDPVAADPDGFRFSTASDALLAETAKRALKSLRLGLGQATDVLAVSFSAPDYVGHRYGPDSEEVARHHDALDTVLAGLLDALDRHGAPYRLVLTSDHGIGPSPVNAAGRAAGARMLPKAALARAAEDALAARFPLAAGEGPWVLAVESTNLALNRLLAKSKGLPLQALRQEAARGLGKLPGLAAAYPAQDLADGLFAGRPYAEVLANSWHPARGGDVLFALAELYEIDWADGYAAQHGQPHASDQRVPLVFYGAGIEPGRSDREVAIVDVAPTLARLLGFDFPDRPQGAPLSELLK